MRQKVQSFAEFNGSVIAARCIIMAAARAICIKFWLKMFWAYQSRTIDDHMLFLHFIKVRNPGEMMVHQNLRAKLHIFADKLSKN